MQMISLDDGAQARVEVAGDGTALVLISGLGGTGRLFEEFVSQVVERREHRLPQLEPQVMPRSPE